MDCFDRKPQYAQPQAMFKTLRRLHCHNLENRGLNNLTEAFQSFMTRTKFFSVGRLRRTWSHSAVEFLKYRRLLPMLVSDESNNGGALNDFDPFHSSLFFDESSKPENFRITVSNVSVRATSSQIFSFFSKFGAVQSCHFSSEDRRQIYGTISKNFKKYCSVNITFKREESAFKAKHANPCDLIFYGQQMVVSKYIGSQKRTTSNQNALISNAHCDNNLPNSTVADPNLSRSSSTLSISSSEAIFSMANSNSPLLLDELPNNVLQRIFYFLNPIDRIRLECVNKKWLEAAAKSWSNYGDLSFCYNSDNSNCYIFNKKNPLTNYHLKAFLQRCGHHLKCLNLSGVINLLDDNAIEEIAKRCSNLLELDISGISSTPNALRSLSESLQNLRLIAYRKMHKANELHFWNLFKSNSKTINSVDLRGCVRLRGRCFKLFGAELEEVLLDGCRLVDDEVIEDICLRSNGLRVLSLSGCKLLTDESLSLISRNLIELTRLNLNSDFLKLTPSGLVQLSRLSSLQHLSFNYNSCVTDALINAIVDGIPHLQTFSIAFAGSDLSITEQSLLKLTNLQNLTEIDVSGIAAINNNFFISLCSPNKKLKKITAQNCVYLGENGINALINLKKIIENIDLSGCILVTSDAIKALIKKFHSTENENTPLPIINLVVGGTLCEKSQIKVPVNSRVHIDFNEYNAFNLNAAKSFFDVNDDESDNDEEHLANEISLLSAHRSFVADAFNVEEELPNLENDKEIVEWAEKEAAQLNLFTI